MNSQPVGEKRIHISILGVVLGFGLLLCILPLGLFWLAGPTVDDPPIESAVVYQPAPTPGSDLDMIEADAEITIPPSAREIHAMISGFRELDTWVRLDLPAGELASFMEGTCCESPLVSASPEKHGPGDLDPDWWQPHVATDLVECKGGHSFLRQRILVDRTNPQVFTIYVFSITGNFADPTTSSQ
jgi:hypothetical protein